jgi:hypothetical protein
VPPRNYTCPNQCRTPVCPDFGHLMASIHQG